MGSIDFSSYGSGNRYRRTEPDLLMASPVTQKIYLCDADETADGVAMTATLTRESLPLGGTGPGQWQLSDLWPELEASGPLAIQLGFQKKLGDAITWGSSHPFNPAVHAHFAEACQNLADLAMTGRFISIRFESTTNLSWTLQGYALEFEPQGKY
ncbi:MAG: hypothetical protein HQL84_10100 [Magnetococcales bacterium]|nr:hypothetical protein [Magnetococcales bacterium]MBF0150383.1 hypothetical protein [Magnetococcales bacterium]MBF0175051.1 hypothetical protein [Magnetococcales bacterium]MBF0348590.1 hypothetical protein [Magnetococcales bacterium]MBF0631571.1 hypothetical protein [Magnetococcales bacterium]